MGFKKSSARGPRGLAVERRSESAVFIGGCHEHNQYHTGAPVDSVVGQTTRILLPALS